MASRTAEFLEKTATLLSGEEYDKALQELEEYLTSQDNEPRSSESNAALLLRAAEIFYRNQRYTDARESLDRLRTDHPETQTGFQFIVLRSQLCMMMGEIRESLELLQHAIEQAWPEDHYYTLNYYLGKAHFRNGDYHAANRLFQASYRHYASGPNHAMRGCILYMLGYIAFQRSYLEIAGAYFRRALEDFTRGGKKLQVAATHTMLGILQYRSGRYDEADENLSLARNYFARCSNRVMLIDSEVALARVAFFRGQYRSADKVLLSTLRRSRRIGYRRGTALSAEFLGELRHHLSRNRDALRYLKQAEQVALQIAPRGDIAVEVYRRLGDVYLAIGQNEAAEEALSKALDLGQGLEDRYELGAAFRAFGNLASRRGEYELAQVYFSEAISALKMAKEPFELARSYLAAAEHEGAWAELATMSTELRREHQTSARSFAVEAMHLFSSIGLDQKARQCEAFVHRLKSGSAVVPAAEQRHTLSFDEGWLIGGILVARSQQMLEAVSRVRKLAPTAIPVTIEGETGTGKELVARLLHRFSDRSTGPFVPVNCANLPETVFESEMFGHKRGSFTGAMSDKMGLLEQARGGTLFMDEISELSHQQQAKMLRALEDGSIRRLGETTERAIDVRLVSASNESLETLVESGRLRGDFFYRIAGQVIRLEPLRQRRDDIPALFAYYVSSALPGLEVEDEVMELLQSYHWPGNVRELIHVVNALVLVGAESKIIRVCDLPLSMRDLRLAESMGMSSGVPRQSEHREDVPQPADSEEAGAIRALTSSSLRKWNDNRSAAARELGISRSTLYRRMKKLDIS